MSQFTALIIFIAFIGYVLWQGVKNFQLRNLNLCIQKKDWDTVLKLTNMSGIRKILGSYTCDLYELRAFYLSDDMQKFESKVKQMVSESDYSKENKKTFLEQYYHRFLLKGDREHAKMMLEQIKTMGDELFVVYNEQSFYVMFDKRTDLIQTMTDEINSKKYYGFPLGVILFMIAKQYEYLGDTENASIYYENAKVCFHPKAIYMPELKKYTVSE